MEVHIRDKVTHYIPVRLKNGRFIEQEIIFEWIHVRCTRCNGLGHIPEHCAMPLQPQWVPKMGQSVIQPVSNARSDVCQLMGTLQ